MRALTASDLQLIRGDWTTGSSRDSWGGGSSGGPSSPSYTPPSTILDNTTVSEITVTGRRIHAPSLIPYTLWGPSTVLPPPSIPSPSPPQPPNPNCPHTEAQDINSFHGTPASQLANAGPSGSTYVGGFVDSSNSFKAGAYFNPTTGTLTVMFDGTVPSNLGSVWATISSMVPVNLGANSEVTDAANFANQVSGLISSMPVTSVSVLGYSAGATEAGVFSAALTGDLGGNYGGPLTVTNFGPIPNLAAINFEASQVSSTPSTLVSNLAGETTNILASNDGVAGALQGLYGGSSSVNGTEFTVTGLSSSGPSVSGHMPSNYVQSTPVCG